MENQTEHEVHGSFYLGVKAYVLGWDQRERTTENEMEPELL